MSSRRLRSASSTGTSRLRASSRSSFSRGSARSPEAIIKRRTPDGQPGLSEPTTRPASSSAGPQQDHRLGGERLTRAYGAKVVGGGGLDVHRARLDLKRRSQAAPDLLAVGAQPRGLRQQG